jgi:hypothetical protein
MDNSGYLLGVNCHMGQGGHWGMSTGPHPPSTGPHAPVVQTAQEEGGKRLAPGHIPPDAKGPEKM